VHTSTLHISLDALAQPPRTAKHKPIEMLPIGQDHLTALNRDDRRAKVLPFVEIPTLVQAGRDRDAEVWMARKK
jgi:hypothetical protein